MVAKDVIFHTLNMNHSIVQRYLSDLSDADLLKRPVPGANHIAWQLGHLILTEHRMMTQYAGLKLDPLPSGFEAKHARDNGGDDAGFLTKAEYLAIWDKIRAGVHEAFKALPEADLDKPLPDEIKRLAPTLGLLFFMVGNHELMHAGQFAVVRRLLQKPIVI